MDAVDVSAVVASAREGLTETTQRVRDSEIVSSTTEQITEVADVTLTARDSLIDWVQRVIAEPTIDDVKLILLFVLPIVCITCIARYFCQPEWQYESFRDEEDPPVSCCYYTYITTCCCSSPPPRRLDRERIHPFFARSRKAGATSRHTWRPLASLRRTFDGMDFEERLVHTVNMMFVPVLCGLYYYELYQNVQVCLEARAAGDMQLLLLIVVFQFSPILHIFFFVHAHSKPLRDIGVDIFWTMAQELTLSGPLIGLVQLVRDGEMPLEFISTASSAAQLLYCIIPQSATQLVAIQTAGSPRLRSTLEMALYSNLAIAAVELWKGYFVWGPPLNLQRYRYAKHSEHWWLMLLLPTRAASAVGLYVLGPALVATLVDPYVTVGIVTTGLIFACVDMWGSTIFPHMWDQHTGQSWACTPFGWYNWFVAAPQGFPVDGAMITAAAVNQNLLCCGLDTLTLPLWVGTSCAGSLLYEYINKPEVPWHHHEFLHGKSEAQIIEESYMRLAPLLAVYAGCVAYWLITLVFLRCMFATGRKEAIEKATAFQGMFNEKREQARESYASELALASQRPPRPWWRQHVIHPWRRHVSNDGDGGVGAARRSNDPSNHLSTEQASLHHLGTEAWAQLHGWSSAETPVAETPVVPLENPRSPWCLCLGGQ